MPPAPGQDEPLKRMVKIVNSLLARPDIAPFREPVDWRGLELYDYPKVISKMMDLGTIKRRLERGQYATAHQVAEDVRLVWSNCMTCKFVVANCQLPRFLRQHILTIPTRLIYRQR